MVSKWRFSRKSLSFTNTFLIYVYNMDLNFKQSLGPPKESIKEHLPEIFLKYSYAKSCVIIYCAEVCFKRPKSLPVQAATWSDYKYHIIFKLLVGITSTRFIYLFRLILLWWSSKWQIYHLRLWVLWFIRKIMK